MRLHNLKSSVAPVFNARGRFTNVLFDMRVINDSRRRWNVKDLYTTINGMKIQDLYTTMA